MPVSQYINVIGTSSEQSLVDDLVVETIQLRGHNMHYIPRTYLKEDYLFGNDYMSAFVDDAVLIEMIINSIEEFGGDGDFFGSYGIEISDTTNLTVSKTTFTNLVTSV